ncbi:MAG: cytochrome b N-terminal domain-containing protein [Candidatus Melainabacteria bacterium]|nr:cytochrome b N-terminal domain-containing protein [Candidatus Melainabacteria bacterium]
MYTEPIRKHLVLPLEKFANEVFSQKYNPFYYHGALPNVFIWSLFISGLVLFAYYQPTLATAYESVSLITYELPYGNAFRSMHRYAADGMMIFVLLHMFRVWFTDRFREYRILPWLTGVIIISLMLIIGLTGYMLIWDQEAKTLTEATFSLMSRLPLIGDWLVSLLLVDGKLQDNTLTKIMFLHFAIPVLLMFLLFLHYMRITRPVTTPPLALIVLLFGGVVLVSGLAPVGLGQPPAVGMPTTPVNLQLDLLYAWPQWLLFGAGWSPVWVWVVTLAVPVLLVALPYVQKKGLRSHFAQVTKDNCTGCSLCYHDCPYEAIEMVDRNDGSRFKRLATVDPGRCANCGLCVGACAFKAIEIPRRESPDVLEEIQKTFAAANALSA